MRWVRKRWIDGMTMGKMKREIGLEEHLNGKGFEMGFVEWWVWWRMNTYRQFAKISTSSTELNCEMESCTPLRANATWREPKEMLSSDRNGVFLPRYPFLEPPTKPPLGKCLNRLGFVENNRSYYCTIYLSFEKTTQTPLTPDKPNMKSLVRDGVPLVDSPL